MILSYERLSYLWNNQEYESVLDNFILNLIDFTFTKIKHRKVKQKIPISRIHDEFKMLVKQNTIKKLIDYIKTEFWS